MLNPFEIVAQNGESNFTLFSGGAELRVQNVTSHLIQAWSALEDTVSTPEACEMLLSHLHTCAIRAGKFSRFISREKARGV